MEAKQDLVRLAPREADGAQRVALRLAGLQVRDAEGELLLAQGQLARELLARPETVERTKT